MKILVTGGAGFIASNLVDKLIELGHEVSIVDNLFSGKRENINQRAKFYEEDITNSPGLEKVFQQEKPEIVFHLAALPLVASTKEPSEDARVNIVGSINLIILCKDYKVKKIIYSNSGGASYGEPLFLPMNEEHPLKPVCPYAISKHTVEHYLEIYKKDYGLNFTSLRYANVYGSRQDPFGEGGVIAIFTNKLLKRERPTIFGDGTQIRDYVYVEDVVNANIWAIDNGGGEAYNVGCGVGTTTQEIFDVLNKEISSNLQPIYECERIGDVKECILDSTKLRKIGWFSKYNLREGIKKTIEYYKREYAKETRF